jgi:putative ABC transport system permease protein
MYSLVSAVVATLLCGLFPAIRGTQRSLASSLAHSSRSQVSGRNPLQWALVSVQVALAVTLLAGAGLLLRSFQALGRVSPGFDASHVLTFRISASYGETADWKGLTQRIDRTIEELRGLPGVEAAAATASLPGVPTEYETKLQFTEGEQDPNRKMTVESRFISPGYFATMKIPLYEGEVCREPKFTDTPADPSGRQHTPMISLQVLVNRSFENMYAGARVIGRHVHAVDSAFLQATDIGEVRGVVGDAREKGMNRVPSPTVYWCFGAPGGPDPFYLVRTHTEPMGMAETIRKKIKEIEPQRSVFDIRPLPSHIDDAFAENRMRTILLSFFAVTAISLACIGLYGTLSYSVNVRKREIGLRLALGSRQEQVLKKFLLQGLRVALLGCVVGCGLTLASSRVLAGMLYGISPWDATTLAMVVGAVLLVAALASLLPAMRAARVDPMRVLREE